ncbi:MAG: hypothetical protein ACPGXX_14730 [Planctomycetaceae bacterium]
MVEWLLVISILVIWLGGWLASFRMISSLTWQDHPTRIVFACIVPSAMLVGSIHGLAMLSMFSGGAFVTTFWIALAYGLLSTIVFSVGSRSSTQGEQGRDDGALGDATSDSIVDSHVPVSRLIWLPGLAVVGGCYVVFLADALTRFPHGADALHYHLPVALSWIQTGKMDLWLGVTHQSFPENGMFLPMLMATLGWEPLLNVSQLPAVALVALCTFGLARKSGASVAGAWCAASIALMAPMVLFQGFSGYIDLFGAAWWLASLVCVVAVSRSRSWRETMMLGAGAGLAGGIALGTKSTYLVLVPLLACVLLGVLLRNRRWRHPSVRHAAVLLTVFFLSVGPGSVHWFARGLVQAGNPIYPLGISIGEHQLLPGFSMADEPHFRQRSLGEKLGRWSLYPWRETKHSGSGYALGRGSGFGPLYTAFVPIGCLWVAWHQRRRRGWATVFAGLTAVGVVLHLTLLGEMLRFSLPFVLVAVPASALMLDHLLRSCPRAVAGMFLFALACTAGLCVLEPLHDLAGRARSGAWSRQAFYGMPAGLNEVEAGATIVNLANAYATYPLMGESGSIRVITPIQWRVLNGLPPMVSETVMRNEHAGAADAGNRNMGVPNDANDGDGLWSAESGIVGPFGLAKSSISEAELVAARSSELLARHDVGYVFARPTQIADWPPGLLEPVHAGTSQPSVMFSRSSQLYRVVGGSADRMVSRSGDGDAG